MTIAPAAPAASEADALIAQGLHEDVCGEVSRFRALAVISPISAAAVADRSDAEIGTVLGATHVLRGRLRRAGELLEVSASLVACAGATQLWTERLTAPAEEFFSLREGIVARIVATLAARLEETVLAEARRRPTESLAAYALTLRGLAANDPTVEQYQLFIVDRKREGPPVDGGVFNVPAGQDELRLAVDAKLLIGDPAAFVITVERPGGVVVSRQERVAMVAAPG